MTRALDMTNDVKQELTQYLIEMIEGAKGLTAEHMPLLIQDLLLWAQIRWIPPFLLTLALACLVLWLSRKSAESRKAYLAADRDARREMGDDSPVWLGAAGVTVFVAIFPFGTAAFGILGAIKATFTPYAYLLGLVL